MDKIILNAQNREELDKMIKRTLTLEKDETFKITVIKEPKKILFFNLKGKYQIDIVKKYEIEKNEFKNDRYEKKNFEKFDKFEKKDVRKDKRNNRENFKKEKNEKYGFENKKFSGNRANRNFEQNVNTSGNKENEVKEIRNDDSNYDRIRSFMKEFIVNSKLDLKVVDIKRIEERYVVNVDGKDIRYLIGEKGSTLNSVEYLLSSVKNFKNIRVVIDSNDYKQKREESLRDLARKKGKKVLETGRNVKLNPMSARERKIIHEEISFMKGLKTESVGEEPKRYLIIKRTRD
ncbi:protein jag [Pseudoleptotrichia goodfellowii]|uniref:Ribosomal protein L6 n=1 Tax=Pseudoleptotrichia goodfellowii F0264 TaxID=596323 RepID=D0GKU6_9FUSO|nr:R3H domain-containing nucleic acid-binding protein [Pseudoleptotrichia goodfellowii]EEY35283.1 ribosomal protein L6 [Pseudoleptotrichia goodfellowii F0264]MBF4806422.1 single-stranded DNA-binding protein [Pseudoleptotrichia goodfellowii]